MKCSGLCYVQGVRPLSRSARQQISIETIAGYLLQKQGSMYIFPGERTGSIKLYSSSNTFYDFGRGVGGDVIKRKLHRQNGKTGNWNCCHIYLLISCGIPLVQEWQKPESTPKHYSISWGMAISVPPLIFTIMWIL